MDDHFHLVNWFYVFARGGGLALVFPAFSAQTIPVRLRIALVAALGFIFAPTLPQPDLAALTTWKLIATLTGEVGVGLLLGFVCRFVFYAVDFAGGIISNEIGLTLSTTFNPLTSAAIPVPGTLLFWMTMMLLFSLNLHHWVIAGFQHTYVLLPPGTGRASEALGLEVIRLTAGIFRSGLQMTAPVLAVSFMVSILFAVLARAVPQMNVFTENFPVRGLVGLIVFGISCQLIAQHVENHLRRIPEDVVRITELLRAHP